MKVFQPDLKYKEDGSSLGHWIKTQRARFNKGELSKERIELLNNIGFVWNVLEKEWEDNFNKLKIYNEKNSNQIPNINHPVLGKWVRTQRVFNKKIECPQNGRIFCKAFQVGDGK